MTDEPIQIRPPAADHSPAYIAGCIAYADSVPREACPYPAGSDEEYDWLEGWDLSKHFAH